jgi:hypothetical protein
MTPWTSKLHAICEAASLDPRPAGPANEFVDGARSLDFDLRLTEAFLARAELREFEVRVDLGAYSGREGQKAGQNRQMNGATKRWQRNSRSCLPTLSAGKLGFDLPAWTSPMVMSFPALRP